MLVGFGSDGATCKISVAKGLPEVNVNEEKLHDKCMKSQFEIRGGGSKHYATCSPGHPVHRAGSQLAPLER